VYEERYDRGVEDLRTNMDRDEHTATRHRRDENARRQADDNRDKFIRAVAAAG
jgi:hypothetical protein